LLSTATAVAVAAGGSFLQTTVIAATLQMIPKPPGCIPCTLHSRGFGFTNPSGPKTAKVLLLGESAGRNEAAQGLPFVGLAGAMLRRAFRLGGMDEDWFRIDNVVRCQPPGDWLDGAPWEQEAISVCSQYREQTFAEGHPVVVPLGGTATRTLLQIPRGRRFKVQNFHGTVQRDPLDRFWVVPSFHPSYLQRGATNLLDVLRYDLARALEISQGDFVRSEYILTCDPDLDYFTAWAKLYLDAVAHGEAPDLVVDIETMDSSTSEEDERKDISWTIERINFAYNELEGLTVPFEGRYLTIIRQVLAANGPKIFWNAPFDVPRLLKAGMVIGGEWYDYMWAWHMLQSALPRGLGFVAPFYSDNPPWKHLADEDPVTYAAFDGFVTWRVARGITADLVAAGQWRAYKRHIHELHRDILNPCEEIGMLISRPKIETFEKELTALKAEHTKNLQELIPEEIKPLENKQGWRLLSKRLQANPWGIYATKVHRWVQVCLICRAQEVSKKHACKNKNLIKPPQIEKAERDVVRYFRKIDFNPDSWQQILAYIRFRRHVPDKDPKTRKDTTNKDCLDRLYKKHGDRVYRTVLDFRKISKVLGTYVVGTIERMDELDRVHPTFTDKPSTMRMAAENPNTMNVIDDKEGDNPAAGFRKCIIAGDKAYVRRHLPEIIHPEPCVLIEPDFAGIEAVLVGWFSGDPEYIRFAHLGIHARLASIVLDQPAELAWSDDELVRYFKSIKKENLKIYDTCKRAIHGSNYGLTVRGMVLQFPDIFPTEAYARKIQDLYWIMAAKTQDWQMSVRLRAYKQNYLGGPGDHPFTYKHRFYDVLTFKPITALQAARRTKYGLPVMEMYEKIFAVGFGGDAKKCVAFFPQSTARGVLSETLFRLFSKKETPRDGKSYIGDVYFGRTPLRTPVHDSMLLEVPKSKVDFVLAAIVREMTRPITQLPCPAEWGIGPFLNFGVEVKIGTDWEIVKKGGTMEVVYAQRGGSVLADGTVDFRKVIGEDKIGVAGDLRAVPSEADEFEEEDVVYS